MIGIQEKAILIYGVIFICYHLTEFLLHRIIHGEYRLASLLFSFPYVSAQILLLTEYFLIHSLLPASPLRVILGLIGVVSGLGLRWASILTAKQSFNHTIQTNKTASHTLVVHGPYRFFRHPSYLGWYLYSLSVPLLLGTPVSFICFALLGWFFFKHRIQFEEMLLIRFFGRDYLKYKARTHSGLPFIP